MVIRVRSVKPSMVRTPLMHNKRVYDVFAPDIQEPTSAAPLLNGVHLRRSSLQPEGAATTMLIVASDESRFTTGTKLLVDCDQNTK
jgi:NAD(P)-dependent dehydrogenase (short-subunit alcohol dehydrogenase family)